jgi:hypothetical protein
MGENTQMHPLVREAMKKAAVAWLGVGDRPPYAVWCLWTDDSLFVVSGPGEQPAPGLAETSTAIVTARGDHGGRIVSWRAAVTRLLPATSGWDAVASALAAKRLNSVGAEELSGRWAREAVLSQLSPADSSLVDLPDTSLAAPPPPSPAVQRTRKPFRLHRVRHPDGRGS